MHVKRLISPKLVKSWYIFLSKIIGFFVNNKASNLMLFGARDGAYFMDNSRALYEWFNEHKSNQNYYWVTLNPKLEASLKAKGLRVARIDSIEGIILLHKAKYAFFTNRLRDVAIDYRAVPSSLKLIFLSHGQSIKNTRLAVKSGVDAGYRNDTLMASSQMEFAISTSPFMARVQAESNGLKPEMYKLTGFPRNDWMFKPPVAAIEEWTRFSGGKKYTKVVLYAPTWRRNDPKTRMFPFDDFDTVKLLNYLEQENILLLLRLHVQDLKDNKECVAIIKRMSNISSNVRLATINEFVEANFLLPYVDALISDYSSIYHDFLLLDRPIYFIPYDLQVFEQENGFKYPYLQYLPGPVLSSQADLLHHLQALVSGNDQFSVHRAKLSEMIYTFQDGNSCERIAKEILGDN
jgi:CDP-glycerol glycerophosphotransferase (TagB/SpsB family)